MSDDQHIIDPFSDRHPFQLIRSFWWQSSLEEYEVPLDTFFAQDREGFEYDQDIYERRRSHWWEVKLDADIHMCRDRLKLLFTNGQYDEQTINNLSSSKCSRTRELPPQKNHKKMTLFLDMDETLVYGRRKELYEYDMTVHGTVNDHPYLYFVSFRPYLFEFLKELHDLFEIVVFTAGEQSYAEEVIKAIDPKMEYIDYGLFRDSGEKFNNVLVKNLANLGRPLSSAVIVDNLLFSFAFNLDNGILILDYSGDKNEVELKYLKEELKQIYLTVTESLNPINQDVRNVLERKYKIKQRVREAMGEEENAE